jgi:hypothetical protein
VLALLGTTKTVKIGFTGEKERIMQISWSSPNPASVYLFKDLMMEYVDMLASQNMLKLQTKPIPALTNTIELRDFLEEELKPVALMKPEEAMKVLRSSSNELAGLSEEKKALAEHVVFEEDDETGSGLFRAVCELNKECKVVYTTSVLASVANGLDCTSFTISRTNTSATVKVVMRSGMTIDLTMTVGLNESKQRILHGTYPEAHANYGRQFWIRFAEALASQGLLLGQTINRPTVPATTTAAASSSGSSTSPRGASSTTQTAASSASGGSASPRENQQRQNEEDLADDSGLEYDSSDYDNPSSEASVDSDD